MSVNQLPNINASADHALCAGDTATITVVGGQTYTWSTGATTTSIAVSPTTNATYVVVGLDSNNCLGKDSTTITVNQLPVVSFTGLASSYCSSAADVALTGTPSGGTFVGTGVSGTSFSPAAAGSGQFVITYAYADANQCAGIASDTVTVDTCTGIANIQNDFAVTVYPNPFNGQLTLEVGHADQPLQASLVDMMGRTILVREIVTGTSTIASPANLPAGVYLLVLKGNGFVKTYRLLHAE